mmetsp:Transcript_3167/g.6963  ORF Transcript_3167/g.6963 Transcript_3167/m.6963 type:complete len:80 (-) Transcript_3167:231-470(-)
MQEEIRMGSDFAPQRSMILLPVISSARNLNKSWAPGSQKRTRCGSVNITMRSILMNFVFSDTRRDNFELNYLENTYQYC